MTTMPSVSRSGLEFDFDHSVGRATSRGAEYLPASCGYHDGSTETRTYKDPKTRSH